MEELSVILQCLKNATSAEDVFGPLSGAPTEELRERAKKVWRTLVKATHEDLYSGPAEKKLANEAFAFLQYFWKEVCERLDGSASDTQKNAPFADVTFATTKYTYAVVRRIHVGKTCAIFEGVATVKKGRSTSLPVVVRVPHSLDDNDLMEREADNLLALRQKADNSFINPGDKENKETFLSRVPRLLESLQLEEPGVIGKKTVNTFLLPPGLEKGWCSLESIRAHYPHGVSTRVMVFIWNRILEALTLAHLSSVLHGAVTPNHVLIHPETHLGQLVDWTASVQIGKGENVPYVDSDTYGGYFPDEFLDTKSIPSPASDIYMSAWCMVYILGGDPKESDIPASVEKQIRGFLNRCVQPKRSLRPQTAEAAYKELRRIACDLFGAPKFVEFSVPQV